MLALLFDGTQGSFEIARIVHSVEYAKDIDAIYSGALDEFFHDIIGVVPIAQQVLASQQHLLARVGHGLLEFANALPRVFSQVADTGIEGRTAPAFHRPETNLIELGSDRQHVFQANTGG